MSNFDEPQFDHILNYGRKQFQMSWTAGRDPDATDRSSTANPSRYASMHDYPSAVRALNELINRILVRIYGRNWKHRTNIRFNITATFEVRDRDGSGVVPLHAHCTIGGTLIEDMSLEELRAIVEEENQKVGIKLYGYVTQVNVEVIQNLAAWTNYKAKNLDDSCSNFIPIHKHSKELYLKENFDAEEAEELESLTRINRQRGEATRPQSGPS